MAILERRVQYVIDMDSYLEWEKKWIAVEDRMGGFPTKRYSFLLNGRDPMGTHIWEREWPNLTEMDAAYQRLLPDPESEALLRTHSDVIKSEYAEIYQIIS